MTGSQAAGAPEPGGAAGGGSAGSGPAGKSPAGDSPAGDSPAGDSPAGNSPAGSDRALLLARQVIGELTARRLTLAVAESLTGGLLAATLTAVPGASAAFRGGVVAYATAVKESVLGVPGSLLARHGAVHPDVAAAMADGVRNLLQADLGAGTTGVAGPDPSDGQPVGTVYIAASRESLAIGRALALLGGRQEIRVATVEHSLQLLLGLLREDSV